VLARLLAEEQTMRESGRKATPAASDLEGVSVKRLQGYLVALDGILEVCRQAQREGKVWPRARCKAILADCRKRFRGRLKRMDKMYQTPWEVGLSNVLEALWETLQPVPRASETELIGRVKDAHVMALTLEKMLSAMVVLESVSPVAVEEALERFYGADGEIPF
jgi:hypothetical protein